MYHSQRHNKHASIRPHLQMKSLKSSDQSSGWWRVGGGFLLKESNGKDKWKDKMRWDLQRRGGEQKAKAETGVKS